MVHHPGVERQSPNSRLPFHHRQPAEARFGLWPKTSVSLRLKARLSNLTIRGTFTAVKVQHSAALEGSELELEVWYARGVGMIKSRQQLTGQPEVLLELESYAIPK